MLSGADLSAAIFHVAENSQRRADLHLLVPWVERIPYVVEALSGKSFSQLFIASQKVEMRDDVWTVLCTHAQNCRDFTAAHVPVILQTISLRTNERKLSEAEMGLVKRLCIVAINRLPHFDLPGVASTLKSLAQLNVYDESLVTRLCVMARANAGQCTPEDIGAILYGVSTFRVKDELLIRALSEQVQKNAGDFSPSDITFALVALGKSGIRNEALVKRLCIEAALRTAEFQVAELANIIHALGKLGFCEQKVIQRLCNVASRRVNKCTAEDVTNALCGLALLKHSHAYDNETFVLQLTDEVIHKTRLRDSTPEMLVMLLDSLGKLGTYDRNSIERIVTTVIWKVDRFSPAEIASVLNTLGRFGWYQYHAVDTIGLEIMRRAADFKPEDIELTLKALDKLYAHDDHRRTELRTRLAHPKAKFVENPMPYQGIRKKTKPPTLQEVPGEATPVERPPQFKLIKIPPRKPKPAPDAGVPEKDDLDVLRGFFG